MAYPHDENPQDMILDGRHDAIVARAVLPEASKAGAPEGFADAARIVQPGDAVVQEAENAPRRLRVELAELAPRGGIQLNAPCRSPS